MLSKHNKAGLFAPFGRWTRLQRAQRLLLVLRDMTEQSAYPIYLALDVPVFFLFFWLGQNPSSGIRSVVCGTVALFLIVHALLHCYLSGAPEYTFSGALSNSLIYAAALCGLVYLILPIVRSSPDAT